MLQLLYTKNGTRGIASVVFAVLLLIFSPGISCESASAFIPANTCRKSFTFINQRQQQLHISSRKTNSIISRPIISNDSNNLFLISSPSGIDQLPELVQAGVFVAYFFVLGVATVPTIKLLDIISTKIIGLEGWRNWFIDTSLPLLLGTLYITAGIGHFVKKESFIQIYPPTGTWGLWYLPGSANFHVMWTGIVEFLGGSALLLGVSTKLLGVEEKLEKEEEEMFGLFLKLLTPLSALILFLLTLLVTPANIYMYTHGATLGDSSIVLNLSFHYIRLSVQIILLSLLLLLAKDSLFFAWGDELD